MKELDAYLEHLKERDLAPNSIKNYTVQIRIFARWFENTTGQTAAANNVTPLDIRQYRNSLKSNYKASSINTKLMTLSGFFKWTHASGRTASDPTKLIKRMNPGKRQPKWLTRPETYTLLRQTQQNLQMAQAKKLEYSTRIATRTATIVILLLNTGLRVSELCALQQKDIRIEEQKAVLTIRSGKGNKYREIPLNADARRAIQSWLTMSNAESKYIFTSESKRPLTRQTVEWHLKKLGQKIGIHLHAHKLRHTFAKNLIDQNVQIDRVATLMGHSKLESTMLYTQASLSDLEREVTKIQWED